jgi:hypothetical protein
MSLDKKNCKDFITVYDNCWFSTPQLHWTYSSCKQLLGGPCVIVFISKVNPRFLKILLSSRKTHSSLKDLEINCSILYVWGPCAAGWVGALSLPLWVLFIV